MSALRRLAAHPATFPSLLSLAGFAAGVAVGLLAEEWINRGNSDEDRDDDVLWTNQLVIPFDTNEGDLVIAPMSQRRPEDIVIPDWPNRSKDVMMNEDPVEDPYFGDDEEEEDGVNSPEDQETVERFLETRNVFDPPPPTDGWDYDHELSIRTDNAPYVLHRDEYTSGESNLPQQTLTYYAGDDVLVDGDNVPIYNPSVVVGDFQWGHGSGFPDIFYVRNPERQHEYEVVRMDGRYTTDVLGYEIEESADRELRHSGIHSDVLKFRQE